MHYKKMLLTLATLLLGVMFGGAMAAPTYNATVNGTNYDFTYITGSFNGNSAILQSQPWWGSPSDAITFSTAVGGNLGFPNSTFGPYFAYTPYVEQTNKVAYFYGDNTSVSSVWKGDPSVTYAVATVNSGGGSLGAPEIDGALAPKVGFLLGCLFLLFGRKKENTKLMIAA